MTNATKQEKEPRRKSNRDVKVKYKESIEY